MARFLTLLMIVTLVIAHGSSVAAAVCHHQNAHEHALARESRNAQVAAVSLTEDAAAAVDSKKGSSSASNSTHWPADMLPALLPAVPFRAVERIRLRPASQAALTSTSVPPLLKPPLA